MEALQLDHPISTVETMLLLLRDPTLDLFLLDGKVM